MKKMAVEEGIIHVEQFGGRIVNYSVVPVTHRAKRNWMKTEPPTRPAIPAQIARLVLIEAGHHCSVCGTPCPLERAHIIPWSKTKEHTLENLVCLCANCHQRADSEGWGEKTLQEYKRNPWILRQHSNLKQPDKSATVEFKIQMELEDYGPHQERLLVCALAGFLNVSPEQIQVKSVKRGSVKVTVSLPHEAAIALMKASKENDSELFKSLDPLLVSDISMLSPEAPEGDDSKVVQSRIQGSGGTKLYVGNLSFNTTENDLQDAFAAHGTVTSVNLIMDKMSGRSRGFAFVTMDSPESAKAAIAALHGAQLDGRPLTVNEARPREENPFRSGGGGRRSSKNRDGDGGVA